MLIRGCHAPVLVRQGTAEARHRAPTYRERWVKNDGSGTLGYFGDQRSSGNRAAFLRAVHASTYALRLFGSVPCGRKGL